MHKLREEVVDKFSSDLAKLSGEIEMLRRATVQEEENVIVTLQEARTKEEERM